MKFFRSRSRDNGLLAVCRDSDGIAMAAVRRESGRHPSLVACDYVPGNGSDALSDVAARGDFARLPCTSTIDAGDYSMLLVETPDVPPDELRAAMRWRIKDLIDFHIDDAVLDVFAVPSRKGGHEHLMYVVVAQAQAIKRHVDELVDAGLRLTTIDIPELACRNLTALLPEDAAGVAFIHFAPDQGLITLTRQGELYLSRRFEPGLDALLGGATSLSPEVEGRLDAVTVEIQRSLDYYESHFGQPPVAGAVIAPLARPLAGLAEYLAGQLGIKVRVLDISELIDCEIELDPVMQSHCLTAIGAALRHQELTL